jgi:hypothetical protein
LTLLLTWLAMTTGAADMIEKAIPRLAIVLVALLTLYIPTEFGALKLARTVLHGKTRIELSSRPEFVSAAQYEGILSALGDTPKARVLVMHDVEGLGRFDNPLPPPFLDPYRFGALTGIETFPQPRNYSDSLAAPFVKRFGITHLYDPYGAARAALERSYRVIPTPCPYLFRLE